MLIDDGVGQTKGGFNGDVWLGFDRLTCVPIQTRMVKESMLTKEEKAWLKVRFNPFKLSEGEGLTLRLNAGT